eukprot:1183448-Prorocentrum_minimum.AAC.2
MSHPADRSDGPPTLSLGCQPLDVLENKNAASAHPQTFRGELNSPVVNGLAKGLTATWSPPRGAPRRPWCGRGCSNGGRP